jgi:glutamine synthetase
MNGESTIKNEVLAKSENEKVLFIRLQFADILGIPKNIVIPSDRLEEALTDGIPFDGSSIAGYATIEESDKIAKPDPKSFILLPEEIEKRKTAKVNCDIYEPSGRRCNADTKYVLERVVDQAKKLGFLYNTGPECEFFLFKKNGENTTLHPNDSAGYFDLSHRDLAEGVRADISLALKKLGIQTHTSHHEVAYGQHEINFKYADALTTADRILTLKYVTKVIATKHELHASFMPKPLFGTNGSGMHTHISLFDLKNNNAFYDKNDVDNLSQNARFFIAGLLKYIKEITAILNPTVNSYKRLIPGYEAPTYISWAHRNRSALIRIPAGVNHAKRCELRSPDLSGNPYLQFAVILAAGLKGVEGKIPLMNAVEKNIYSLNHKEKAQLGIESLPESLGHALNIMSESTLLKETLGKHIFDNYLHVKTEEWNSYRMQVTSWEINKYFKAI